MYSQTQEHIPLGKSMLAMTIKAISVAGMGRFFMDRKEIDKMAIAYEVVSKSFAAFTLSSISSETPRMTGNQAYISPLCLENVKCNRLQSVSVDIY